MDCEAKKEEGIPSAEYRMRIDSTPVLLHLLALYVYGLLLCHV